MKKLLCLLFAALLLCVSASALELPSELDGTVPRESAKKGTVRRAEADHPPSRRCR